jgi:hypothetical protein
VSSPASGSGRSSMPRRNHAAAGPATVCRVDSRRSGPPQVSSDRVPRSRAHRRAAGSRGPGGSGPPRPATHLATPSRRPRLPAGSVADLSRPDGRDVPSRDRAPRPVAPNPTCPHPCRSPVVAPRRTAGSDVGRRCAYRVADDRTHNIPLRTWSLRPAEARHGSAAAPDHGCVSSTSGETLFAPSSDRATLSSAMPGTTTNRQPPP